MQKKLELGQRLYGNRAMGYRPTRLIAEIDEELVDIVAWGFFAWLRLRELAAEVPKTKRKRRR